MKVSICTKLFSFFTLAAIWNQAIVQSYQIDLHKRFTQKEIDAAWIQVHWSNGGHYYHNTITKDDRDQPPSFKYKKTEL